jgi:hypothetical protein
MGAMTVRFVYSSRSQASGELATDEKVKVRGVASISRGGWQINRRRENYHVP